MSRYQKTVSILKKGYIQESYRIKKLNESFLADMSVDEIHSYHIADYRDMRLQDVNSKTGKLISPATVRLEMALLSNFFDIARIEWGMVSDNPVKEVRKPKPSPGRVRRLTPREERLILRYCHNYSNPELYILVSIALETAMRQGEIIGLRWENIDLFRRVAHLPDTKNGSMRDVPLSSKAKDLLIKTGVKTTGPVFSLSQRGLKTAWRVMMKNLEIEDLRFHDLRHEAISRLFELSTLETMEVSAISGHKSLSMLKRYTHLQAHKLVKKLDGNKSKGKQIVLNYLLPYPAWVLSSKSSYTVVFPDFKEIGCFAKSKEEAIEKAKDTLLRAIMTHIKEGKVIPRPDSYLTEMGKGCEIIMIDPMEKSDCNSEKVFL